jgi:hypothetical protein
MEDKKSMARRIGITVLVLLLALTIGEFLIGAYTEGLWTALFGISLIKAFFVVRDYMHIGRLFGNEEEVGQ